MSLPGVLKNRLFNNRFLESIRNKLPGHHYSNDLPLLCSHDIVELQKLASKTPWSPSVNRDTAQRLTGDMRSIFLGSGMDYEESRLYVQGDDMRLMNWRLTARTGERYMKVFREEKRPSTFILLDKRAAMRFGTRKRIKLQQALRITGYIAFSSLNRHCGVAAAVMLEDLNWLETCYNEETLCHLLNIAAEACLPGYKQLDDEITIDSAIKLLPSVLVEGTDVCLVSDFNDLSEDSRSTLLQLSLECNVTAFHITDEAESSLPEMGEIKLCAHADAEDVLVDTNNALPTTSDIKNNNIQKLFSSLGVAYHRISTDIDMLDRELFENGG